MDSIGIKEQCSIMIHINDVARGILDKNNVLIEECEQEVFYDIYKQVLREAGAYNLDSINSEYLFDIHQMLDCYQLPKVLQNKIDKDKQNENCI